MCGRLSLSAADHRAAAILLADAVPGFEVRGLATWLEGAGYRPRTNVGPGQIHWLVRGRAGRPILDSGRWGLPLSPPGQKAGPQPGQQPGQARPKLVINARAETLATRPLFRAAFGQRRALIPADGFFEWDRSGPTKVPHWFHDPEGRALLFAAVFEAPTEAEVDEPPRFSIVTTPANEIVARLHPRMPAIVEPDAVAQWLFGAPAEAAAVLGPSARELEDRPVSPRFNATRYEGALE